MSAFDTLCPCQQFVSHIGMFSWFEPIRSNADKMSPGHSMIRTRDLLVASPTLNQLSNGAPKCSVCLNFNFGKACVERCSSDMSVLQWG